MNCKPGDLAVVIFGDFTGYICKVMHEGATLPHEMTGVFYDGWIVEFPHEMRWATTHGAPLNTGWQPDAWLRPIRDPGDDAVDEMVQKLGAPTRDEVAA